MNGLRYVAFGASAGGVLALRAVVSALPSDLPAAVFIVTHIPPFGQSQLAQVLQRVTKLDVRAATDGEVIAHGCIYVAVPDRHLIVEGHRIRLSRGPKEARSRPSIDALFRSVAVAGGANVVGVVLSGLLDDGTAGLWAIKDRGGAAIVQDPSSAEYASMPESASRHVDIDASLPLADLAGEIQRRLAAMPAPMAPPSPSIGLSTEVAIAMEGNGLKAGVMNLGPVSRYTCPDCHGVLVQIEEGSIVRFRCHTGHAFSIQTLLLDVNAAIDKGLWATLRAIEERIMLLRQLAERATVEDEQAQAQVYLQEAQESEKRTALLRSMVVDPSLFGHGQ